MFADSRSPQRPPPGANTHDRPRLAAEGGAPPALGKCAPEPVLVDRLMGELQRRAGFAPNAILRKRVETLLSRLDETERRRWASIINSNDSVQWQPLFDAVAIHETYFMRDLVQLEFLRTTILPELIEREKSSPSPTLRIWSAACSTGEEAYSLAFLVFEALFDAGLLCISADGVPHFGPQRWTIDILGTDLSREAIETAQGGTYPPPGVGALRGLPVKYWKFFRTVKNSDGSSEMWTVNQAIRNIVRFDVCNLRDGKAPRHEFDIVICRNVLIYFDDKAREETFELVHSATKANGIVAFGPTDIPTAPGRFTPIWGQSTVLYRKVGR